MSYEDTLSRVSKVAPVVKNLPVNAGGRGDAVSIPGTGRSSGVGNGTPTPVFSPRKFCGQRSLVGSYRGAKSWTQLSMHATLCIEQHGEYSQYFILIVNGI